MPNNKNKTFVTFGQVHAHSINGQLIGKDHVAVISCETEEDGRNMAFELFGDEFFTTYHEQMPDMSFYPAGLVEVY